jgi:hypothetical protein
MERERLTEREREVDRSLFKVAERERLTDRCHMRRRIHVIWGGEYICSRLQRERGWQIDVIWGGGYMSYEEEDTSVQGCRESYEEEDTSVQGCREREVDR